MFNVRRSDAPARLTRRWFLRGVGGLATFGGIGMLVACQGPAQSGPPSSASALPTASPGVAANSSPVSAPVAGEAGAVAPGLVTGGRPMYQMDAQHTGRSPYGGPRRA